MGHVMKTKTKQTSAEKILVILAAFVIVVAGMKASTEILVPFLLAAFIAIVAAPPMFWLSRRGVPVWVAWLIVICLVMLFGLLISGLIGSSVKSLSENLPAHEKKFREYAAATAVWLQARGINASDMTLTEFFDPGAAMRFMAVGLNNFGKVLTNGFLILMTVIFMLFEAFHLPDKIRVICGDKDRSFANFYGFIENVNRYMIIKTIFSLATGVLVTVWVGIVGLDYAVLWGVLAFLFNYVPNIGSIIAALPAILIAIVQLGFFRAGATAAGYLVINMVLGSMIEPRFMGKGVGLSTLVVFLSLLFWGWVLGPVGMFLSVPLTITAKIALNSLEETRWLAVLLGPEISQEAIRTLPEKAPDPPSIISDPADKSQA
jgi:predicted PurR-regulated permease PerM